MGLLENARLFSRDDEWQKELQRSDEVIQASYVAGFPVPLPLPPGPPVRLD